jgi:hypothetical protein
MAFCTQRRDILGLCDRLHDLWLKLMGKPPELRGDVTYAINETSTTLSNP